MLKIKDLTYKYDDDFSLKISKLDVDSGNLVFLVGPNGSGKTTLLKLITDELEIQSGSIQIDNSFPSDVKVKKNLLYMGSGTEMIPTFLTCYEFNKFMCKLYGVEFNLKKYEVIIQKYKMENFHRKLIEEYSHGMKKKTLLIVAAMIEPKILILDETLNGIDIEAKIIAKEMLYKMINDGKLVIFATHDLNLVEELKEQLLLILNGNIFYNGLHEDLKKIYPGLTLENIIQDKVKKTYETL